MLRAARGPRMRLITELVRDKRGPQPCPGGLTRRQILFSGTAGLVVLALPSCTIDQVPFYVPPTGPDGSGGTDGGMSADGASPPPDQDSTIPPDDSSSQPPDDSSVDPTDSGSMPEAAPMETGPVCMQNANTLVVPLAQHPELGSTGGNTMLTDSRYSDPVCQQDQFFVVTTGPGTYAAFSAACTHRCCTLQVQGNSFYCPCHGATFDLMTGAVTGFPASRALPSLPVCSDGTNLYVQLA